jgi:hypothetical protein
MSKIYDTQFFRLIVSTGIDLKLASQLKIVYRGPNNISGTWDATLDSEDTKRMYYDTPALNYTGRWNIYSKAVFPQG